jgi:dienelactone hydrolase
MVTTRDVEYSADGTVMVGRLALPDGAATRPAVLVAHEGPGLPGITYHPNAAERSWRAMLELFDEVFG